MVPKEEINKRRSTLLLILSIIAATLLLLWVILYFDKEAGGERNDQSMQNYQIKYTETSSGSNILFDRGESFSKFIGRKNANT